MTCPVLYDIQEYNHGILQNTTWPTDQSAAYFLYTGEQYNNTNIKLFSFQVRTVGC